MDKMTANMYVRSNIIFSSPEDSVFDAYEKMKREQIHHIPIIDNGEAMGIVSDRDLQYVTLAGNSKEIKCRDIMTERPVCVTTETPLKEVAQIMLDKNVNSVLINSNQGKIIGIFTSTDAIKIMTNN